MRIFFFSSLDGELTGECFFVGNLVFVKSHKDPFDSFVATKLAVDEDGAPEVMAGTRLFDSEDALVKYLGKRQ